MRAFKVLSSLIVLLIAIQFFLAPYSQSQEQIDKEYWMGIYSGDQRVGYSYNSIKKVDEFTEVKELTNLRINLLGKDNDVYTEGTYKLEGYKILSFEYEMKSDSISLKAEGKRVGNNLEIIMDTVSGKTERTLPIEKELILASMISKLLVENKLKTGDKFNLSLFEPLSILMGMNEPVSTHLIGEIESVEIPYGKFDTYKVESNFMGSQTTSWINEKGEVIKQEFPPGLRAIRESEKDILGKKNSSFDITKKTSITANIKIKDPGKLKYLKIKLEGIDASDGFDIDDGYRQHLDGQIVEINIQDFNSKESSYNLPYNSPEYIQLTEADFLIQSDDKEIVSITNKVLDGETDPVKAAEKINNWIYKNLKKSATVSLPNAKDVLKTRVGDCNEHAALFSAMSRAAGIPTKTVLGTMYFEESFYYHAWNEVYVGEWIAIDSTYGQFPANVTHIKLIEGNLAKSGEILKVVGKLNIEIIDAS
jgi:hypothetical protein